MLYKKLSFSEQKVKFLADKIGFCQEVIALRITGALKEIRDERDQAKMECRPVYLFLDFLFTFLSMKKVKASRLEGQREKQQEKD